MIVENDSMNNVYAKLKHYDGNKLVVMLDARTD